MHFAVNPLIKNDQIFEKLAILTRLALGLTGKWDEIWLLRPCGRQKPYCCDFGTVHAS
jgi:hypothetical protein